MPSSNCTSYSRVSSRGLACAFPKGFPIWSVFLLITVAFVARFATISYNEAVSAISLEAVAPGAFEDLI